MAFDVEGAKKAGYTEAEIADYLAAIAKQQSTDIAATADVPGQQQGTDADVRARVDASGKAWQAAPPIVVGGKEPGYVQSDILPLARRQDVIDNPNSKWHEGWAIAPGPLRALGQTPAENVTINPETGALNLAPEALTTALTLGGVRAPSRMFSDNKLYVPPGTMDRKAPLSPEFTQNPLGPSMTPRDVPPPSGPTSPTGVPPQQPPIAMRAVPDPASVAPQSTVPIAASPNPRTAAGAKEIASSYYKLADEYGGTLTPQFTDRFIDDVSKLLPQTEAGRIVAGESETAALAKRLEDLRGKGTTLQGLQEIDEGMTGLIDKQWSPTGMSKEGLRLSEIQRGLRDQVMNAAEGDIEGGTAGVEALRHGRQAWSQAMKLRDLEAIQRRAEMTEQPSTSIRTQVRTLLGNAKKSRGYSPEEIAALEEAAQRGVLGGAMHVFGSRLVPIVAGAVGVSSGGLGGLLLGAAALPVSDAARSVATTMQTRRLGRAADAVSRSVPRNPLGP